MSNAQIAHNMKVRGGILPMLAGLASQAIPFLTSTVLPALGVGALSGLYCLEAEPTNFGLSFMQLYVYSG